MCNMFKVSNKDNSAMSLFRYPVKTPENLWFIYLFTSGKSLFSEGIKGGVFLMSLFLTSPYFDYFSGIFIADFQQVNTDLENTKSHTELKLMVAANFPFN